MRLCDHKLVMKIKPNCKADSRELCAAVGTLPASPAADNRDDCPAILSPAKASQATGHVHPPVGSPLNPPFHAVLQEACAGSLPAPALAHRLSARDASHLSRSFGIPDALSSRLERRGLKTSAPTLRQAGMDLHARRGEGNHQVKIFVCRSRAAAHHDQLALVPGCLRPMPPRRDRRPPESARRSNLSRPQNL